MARLIYSAMTSLDGYIADADGAFDWAAPDEEVHAFVNELERPAGTYLYGRRMYEVMSYWEDVPDLSDEPAVIQDYAAIWREASKVVFSTTLTSVETARTTLVHEFDPEWVARAKESAYRDMGIGGSELAGQVIRAGLVDEIHLLLVPILVGAGTRALPPEVHSLLRLRGVDRFGSGTVHLHYDLTA